MIRYVIAFLVVAAAPLSAQGQGGGGADIPDGHRPPPGMCRIWLDGVPAGRQPAPTDCATAIRRRPQNARVIFGEELRSTRDQPPRFDRQPRQEPQPDQQPDQQRERQPTDRQPDGRQPEPAARPASPPSRDARPPEKGKERKPDHPRITPPDRHGHPGGWFE